MNIPEFYRCLQIFKNYFYRLINVTYYSVYDLQARLGDADGDKILVDSYYPYGVISGNNRLDGIKLVWVSTQAKSGHDGVTIHSPTVPWDGTPAGITDYLAGTGETDPSGTGCWVSLHSQLNVCMAGADPSGVNSSLASFQATVDTIPDGTLAFIRVPAGTYKGNMSTLTTGTRVLTWIEEGQVTYSNAAPPNTFASKGTRVGVFRAGDANRLWIDGRLGIHTGTAKSGPNDFAMVRVDRSADYTDTNAGVTNAFRLATTVSSGVGTALQRKSEWVLTATITNNSNNCNAVALTGQAVRGVGIDAPVWATQINAIDNRNGTAGLTYVVRGFEANIQGGGIDATDTRSVGDFVAHSLDGATYNAGADNIGYGARVYSHTADFKRGFATQSTGASKILIGYENAAKGTTGFNDIGTWTGRAFNIACTASIGIDLSSGTFSTCAIRLGTDEKIQLTDSGNAYLGYVTASGGVAIGAGGADQMIINGGVQIGAPTGGFKGAGTLNIAGLLYSNGTQVLTTRRTGWTADTGTAKRTANATYSGTASAAYDQVEIQALMDAVRDATQTIKAMKDDNITHGFYGA